MGRSGEVSAWTGSASQDAQRRVHSALTSERRVAEDRRVSAESMLHSAVMCHLTVDGRRGGTSKRRRTKSDRWKDKLGGEIGIAALLGPPVAGAA